ncbi:MAG: rod shape-determining protein, partial [Clostridia bacterium]|nr:rod shape-determining protein [Clostridia bacterium]
YDGYQNGDWRTPGQMIQRVRDSIAAAELEANEKIRELYVGVPGEYVHICCAESEISLGEEGVTTESLDLVQDAAAEALQIAEIGGLVLHRSPAWFQVDDGKKTVEPVGRGNVLRACTSFIVADPQFVEDIKEILGALDITILGFLSPTLGESLLLLSIEDRDRVSVLIDSGYLSTELSVIRGEAIVYHAILPLGGGHITETLSKQLRIPMRAAEQIKRNYVFNPDEFDQDSFSEVYDARGRRLTFPREAISECVEGAMDEICEMIDLTLRDDAAGFLGNRSQVYLTGGGIGMMRNGRDYLAERIGCPVKATAPKTAKMNSPVYSAMLGLIDLTFDSIERHDQEEERFTSKIGGFFKRKK